MVREHARLEAKYQGNSGATAASSISRDITKGPKTCFSLSSRIYEA